VIPSLPVHGVGEQRPYFETLSAIFADAAVTMPDAVAWRHRDASLTYREAALAVAALARRIALLAEPSQSVALLLPNSIEFCLAYWATLEAVAVPALLNPLYPAPQLQPLLREAEPRLILCDPTTKAVARQFGDVLCLGEDVTLADLLAEPHGPPARAPEPDDVAAILFSGGTTGVPKAVEHTHARLVTAVRCVEYNWPTRRSGEVFLPIAPFTHIYGFLTGVLAPVSARAETVIPERFQPAHVVELLSRHRVTVFGGGPPAIYAGVLAAPNLQAADLSALRVCPAGGAPVPVELHRRWREATGREIHEGCGMTEMAPISGTTELSGVRPGSVGPAMPCNTIEIVDLETGERVLGPGERGEIRVRGPHMMRGYRGRPEETAQVLRHGFIYTGDIGHLDQDGFLTITDRKKDVVLVKGFNVFPREVEEVIHTHPKVAAAGVVGAPDARSGERVVAYVVPRAGEALSEAELSAFLLERLVAYKCPGAIRIVDALPMTGVQKLDRAALARQAREEG